MREAKITLLYERLSREDGDDRESNSISTQKNLLEQYAKNNGLPNPTHFTDDGISGTRFDRPGFMAMMEEVEAGNVECIVIKDAYVKLGITKICRILQIFYGQFWMREKHYTIGIKDKRTHYFERPLIYGLSYRE